ncbi:hypothetical protein [Acinetobacter sp.]|uniref:hypothetical protein n=1 Tax=Acinetobacter sp. TaxID=472 RepID=UPI0026478600|nr:hypothetical protein [Acinetobacter sp.]MDN5512776.1 hypothetical protein [Acinetobacter sp.]MDN5525371.1 hypothetical protein [Acinetobacter sp.]
MKMMKTVLITSAILASTPLWAQTATTAPANTSTHTQPAPYGDNPSIFKVLGHKAQQKVQHTAEKVDYGVQKGIAKVKPKVENAWEDTKDFATEKSVIAIEKTQNAAVTVNKKLNETKEGLIGSPNDQPAPIVSRPLSESSTDQQSVPAQQTPAS